MSKAFWHAAAMGATKGLHSDLEEDAFHDDILDLQFRLTLNITRNEIRLNDREHDIDSHIVPELDMQEFTERQADDDTIRLHLKALIAGRQN